MCPPRVGQSTEIYGGRCTNITDLNTEDGPGEET